MIPRIVITPGEPAGIGPDVLIQAAQLEWPAELIAIADPSLLENRAKQIGLPLTLIECDLNAPPEVASKGVIKIIPVGLNAEVIAGKLNIDNAAYVLKTLNIAADLCQKKIAHAVVTGPVHKAIMNEANIPFTGHTEFFADFCGVKKTVMLFVVDKLKVALATTHLPLAKVPENITEESLLATLSILQHDLQKFFGIAQPNILVAGLNPHAGENGHLGKEEITVITPLIEKLQKQNMTIHGPYPADTLFTKKYLDTADAVLAMYHDQALPLIKYIGFDRAVNVTLGLPFIRTSVDHGTALDVAGSGSTNPGSLIAALNLSISLAK